VDHCFPHPRKSSAFCAFRHLTFKCGEGVETVSLLVVCFPPIGGGRVKIHLHITPAKTLGSFFTYSQGESTRNPFDIFSVLCFVFSLFLVQGKHFVPVFPLSMLFVCCLG